ncbi:unnamed protein product, partial [Rotaria sordida]
MSLFFIRWRQSPPPPPPASHT